MSVNATSSVQKIIKDIKIKIALENNSLPVRERCYKHDPDKVDENDSCKLLWDFDVHMEFVIQERSPHAILINKERKERKLIAILCLDEIER